MSSSFPVGLIVRSLYPVLVPMLGLLALAIVDWECNHILPFERRLRTFDISSTPIDGAPINLGCGERLNVRLFRIS